MAAITFYPLGNADCSLIEFADGRLMLIDYYKGKDNDDEEDRRVKLSEELNEVLEDKERDYFDVVAFTIHGNASRTLYRYVNGFGNTGSRFRSSRTPMNITRCRCCGTPSH